MSYHVSTTEVERAIGANAEDALSDSDADTIDQVIQYASSLVDAALINAGYTPPATLKADPSAAVDLVKMATIGAVVAQLYGRKGIKPPESLNVFGATFNAIVDGTLTIPGMTPSAEKAVGRVDFTESDSTVSGSKPKIFGGLRSDY